MLRAAAVLLLALAACPTPEAPISEVCTKHGEKCRTAKGPLGVCDTTTCKEGETGPCFICMPQH